MLPSLRASATNCTLGESAKAMPDVYLLSPLLPKEDPGDKQRVRIRTLRPENTLYLARCASAGRTKGMMLSDDRQALVAERHRYQLQGQGCISAIKLALLFSRIRDHDQNKRLRSHTFWGAARVMPSHIQGTAAASPEQHQQTLQPPRHRRRH